MRLMRLDAFAGAVLITVLLALCVSLGVVLRDEYADNQRLRDAFRARCIDHYLALEPERSAANLFRGPCRDELGAWSGNPAPPGSPAWW